MRARSSRWQTLLVSAMLSLSVAACGVETPEPMPDPEPTPSSGVFLPSSGGGIGKADAVPAIGSESVLPPGLRTGTDRLAFLVAASHVDDIPPEALHVYNDTRDTVELTAVKVVEDLSSPFGRGGELAFSVDATSEPLVLQPGESTQLLVRFQPADDLMKVATLRIETDSAEFPALSVSLVGKVYPDPTQGLK